MSRLARGATFVEARAFTRRVMALELEEPLRALQEFLQEMPEAGDLDPGTGGLRKVRIPDPRRGKGKRSGARVHYLWLPNVRRFYLLHLYTKDEAVILEPQQKRELRAIVQLIKDAAGAS